MIFYEEVISFQVLILKRRLHLLPGESIWDRALARVNSSLGFSSHIFNYITPVFKKIVLLKLELRLPFCFGFPKSDVAPDRLPSRQSKNASSLIYSFDERAHDSERQPPSSLTKWDTSYKHFPQRPCDLTSWHFVLALAVRRIRFVHICAGRILVVGELLELFVHFAVFDLRVQRRAARSFAGGAVARRTLGFFRWLCRRNTPSASGQRFVPALTSTSSNISSRNRGTWDTKTKGLRRYVSRGNTGSRIIAVQRKMIHELLLALSGIPGDLFVEDESGFRVSRSKNWQKSDGISLSGRLDVSLSPHGRNLLTKSTRTPRLRLQKIQIIHSISSQHSLELRVG